MGPPPELRSGTALIADPSVLEAPRRDPDGPPPRL
jgi:hypothetical protein